MGVWLSSVTTILIAAHGASGSVAGIVTDGESGAPLARAVVTLTDLDRSAISDSAGRYLLSDVPPGPQHVEARRIGYARRSFHALVPRLGTLEVHIALKPDPITLPAIDVRARSTVAVPGLDQDGGAEFPDRSLSLAAVRQHPLLSEPDALQALSGGEVVVRPESPSGVHVRGGSADQIAYALDGIPVLSPYHSGGTFGAWNPDALSHIELYTVSPPPSLPDALSGAVSATTRAPGPRHGTQGSVSTTQARVTLDGPLGGGAGYLASFRSAFPGLLVHRGEPSYLTGEALDWLGKIETPLAGGRLRVLSYGAESEVAAIRSAADVDAPRDPGPPRNEFAWDTRSFGSAWTREWGRAAVTVRAWGAAADAGATWPGRDSIPEDLTATRRDAGLVAIVERARPGRRAAAGQRAQRSRTVYEVRPVSGGGRSLAMRAETPVTAAFVEYERDAAARIGLGLSLVGALADGDLHLGPGIRLRWSPSAVLTLSGSYARRLQFAQSLRNQESVIGNVFPPDLYVGAGGAGLPVARSHVGIVALEHRPAAGIRVGAQAYARDLDALALVAPRDGDPYAATGFAVGSGVARGVSVEAAANGARYGLLATYGFQEVRLEYADTTFVPEHGASHTAGAGATIFPAPAFSVRLGVQAIVGRRTTAILGPFEWEACNLLDQGCELAGSPSERAEPLGATRLPAYVRVDLGVRKHWHVRAAGRDAQVALFATATNLLGRRNVLAVAVDPSTGERKEVAMLPLAPLVVGMDWRF